MSIPRNPSSFVGIEFLLTTSVIVNVPEFAMFTPRRCQIDHSSSGINARRLTVSIA
jgi:hypothetical protein